MWRKRLALDTFTCCFEPVSDKDINEDQMEGLGEDDIAGESRGRRGSPRTVHA